MADEWRVAHHIGAFGGRQQLVPVVSQGVGLHDVARIMQRQMRQRLSRDGLRVVQRLLFRDPQRGTRHGHREIVDLDAMHLVDPHLDQAVLAAQFHVALAVQQVGDDAVLQFAQPQIRFGQEVARTARRIYQDLIFDTMPVCVFSPETTLFLGFSAFQGIEREPTSGSIFICCCGCCCQKRHPQSAIVKKYGYR